MYRRSIKLSFLLNTFGVYKGSQNAYIAFWGPSQSVEPFLDDIPPFLLSQESMGDSTNQFEGFDPGSERTLAAWLRHASRTVQHLFVYKSVLDSGERVSNG